MRERGETFGTLRDGPNKWSHMDIELSRADVTIVLKALYDYARVERSVHPRLAEQANAIRRALIKRDITFAEVTAWTMAAADPPLEGA